jgi:hypothetical protein
LVNCNNYAVVYFHFVEYSDNTTHGPNATRLADMDMIIAEALASGCELRLLRTLSDPYKTTPTVAPTPLTPFPTAGGPTATNSSNSTNTTHAPTAGARNFVSTALLALIMVLALWL